MNPPEPPASPSTNLWVSKPWWCQPWSIVLTGCTFVLVSWLPFQRIWLTALAAIGVMAWWLLFLVLAPMAYRQSMLAGATGSEQPTSLNSPE